MLIDQISKYYATHNILEVCNKGIAFGLGNDGLLFSILALVAILWLVVLEKNKRSKLLLVIIFGAGCSNLLDRVFYGCVRDFINIGIFPTFNFADLVITVGVILFLINIVRKNTNGA